MARVFGRVPLLLGGLTLIAGTAAALWYARAGLTLSHYDAKAHLVVSRRILDSLTPGWEQIGAVWLPLPHLINMLPVQIDVFYRTGAFAVALSILQHAIAADVARGDRARADRVTLGRRARGRALRPQSEHALSAEHADDRAAAVRRSVRCRSSCSRAGC